METRANYALIGAFVILAMAAVMGFIMWLGQSQFSRDFDHYDIVFQGPVSLEEGASVRYIGIKVGEVERIAIDRADISKVRARIRIDSQTPVKTDSVASINLAGITGVTFIQIDAGSPEASILERRSGGPVPEIKADRTQLEQLFLGGQEVMQSAASTMGRIDALLTDENLSRIETTLANIEIISEKLARDDGLIDEATTTIASVGLASDSFNAASQSLGRFSDDANEFIAGAGAEFTGVVAELKGVVTSAGDVVEESAKTATAVRTALEGPATGALEDARAVSQDLRVLINRLDRLAREAEQNPQRFVVGDPVPYEEYRQ
ncbi:MAG: MlaD family protein [Hyphomonadaceae bacterium]